MKKNGIDATVFSALKVSEKSKIPVLLISNPGVGKTTAVQYFAKTRGYNLILLRGNTETNESIMGYSVCPPDAKEKSSAIQLRPSWFDKLLTSDKKCLLFLDEITTANEYTQSALLHLIFERKCGTEQIPEDTLIVAAGNYASNLSNSMVMLPPLLSRFMIINITPTADDLVDFLSKYDGSIAGQRADHEAQLTALMKSIDSQEKAFNDDAIGKIGEYFERGIKAVTRTLMNSGERPVSLAVTELQNIYSDTEKDQPLANFVTLRTLNYLRDVTVAEYLCFGKAGIKSDVYKNMVNGLVGLGVSRNNSTGDVVYTSVTKQYFDAMGNAANEIEKMNDSKLPAYEASLKDILSRSKPTKCTGQKAKFPVMLEGPVIGVLTNKIDEIRGDKDIRDIEKPIESELVLSLFKALVGSAQSVVSEDLTTAMLPVEGKPEISQRLAVEDFMGVLNSWKVILKCVESLTNLVNSPIFKYGDDLKGDIYDCHSRFVHSNNAVRQVRNMYIAENQSFSQLIPELPSFKLNKN